MWLEWSPVAFARAKAEKKPILLSLVTAWSDECAAMDRTTYVEPDVVSLIEERFVAVRVDADRRPDVNERYNLGGWPTTVFLTSGGDTLSGSTYLDAPEMIATLRQVADAYRDRADEINARAVAIRSVRLLGRRSLGEGGQPDRNPIDHFRSLLIARFDPLNGGFGSAPKLPHPHALLFALSLAGEGDSELGRIAADTLHRMRALWDPASGGFYRYADGADWSRPGTGKTLDDNAALLHVYVEAALRLRDVEWFEQAAAIVRWVRDVMADEAHGGFFNAMSSGASDKTMYVDRNAMMAGAFIRAAALFDDIWLRDFALKSLEAVIVPVVHARRWRCPHCRRERRSRRARPSHRSNPRRVGVDLGACRDGTAALLDAGCRGASVRNPHDVGRGGGKPSAIALPRTTPSYRSS